jgi:hypothetical protein
MQYADDGDTVRARQIEDQVVVKVAHPPLAQPRELRWAKRQGRPHLGVRGELLEARLGLGEETLGGREPGLFGQVEEMLDEVAAGRFTLMGLGP